MAVRGLGARAGRIVQQRLHEESARPVRAAGRLERGEVGSGGVARHRNEPHVVCAQLLEQHEVARVLHQYGVAGREQDAREQIKRLRGAAGGHDVGGARGDAVLHQAGGDVFAQLVEALWRARQPGLHAAVPHQARERARRHRLEQPGLRQKARAGRDQIRALRERQARERERIGSRVRQRLDRGEGCGRSPLRDEEAAAGARIDQAARHQALVGVDDREGARADLAASLRIEGRRVPGASWPTRTSCVRRSQICSTSGTCESRLSSNTAASP